MFFNGMKIEINFKDDFNIESNDLNQNFIYIIFSYHKDKKKYIKFINCKFIDKISQNKNGYNIDLFILKKYEHKFYFNELNNIKLKLNGLDCIAFIRNNFIFNQDLFSIEENTKLNHLSFKEEFHYYYNFIKKERRDYLPNLISLINEKFTFSSLLTLIVNHSFKEEIQCLLKYSNLSKIRAIGNLNKFETHEVISKLNSIKINKNFEYEILRDIRVIFTFLKDDVKYSSLKGKHNLIAKYKNIFFKSITLFPQYSYLIEPSISVNELKLILDCSNNLFDLINIFHHLLKI